MAASGTTNVLLTLILLVNPFIRLYESLADKLGPTRRTWI